MGAAPDLREQEDCPSAEVCGALCDQHDCGHHPEWFDNASKCHHPDCKERP